jgi:capreomycidine synthase
MKLKPFLIEEQFRKYDFVTDITLCSSGVEPYTLGEVRERLSLCQQELDRVLLRDGHSWGEPDLRHAIAEHFGSGDASRILVTHGSSEGLFLVLTTLLREGDEVVALKPSYQSHYSVAEDLKCGVNYWCLRPESGFNPDLDELQRLLTPRTRALVVCFPNNPTGITLTRADLKRLTDIVSETRAYLLWDAAFAPVTLDRPPLPDPSAWYSRTISFGTLSKAYGLAGLRVGWVQGPMEVLESCVRLRDYTTLNLSPLNEFIARRAIEKPDCLLVPRLQQAKLNLELLRTWVSQHGEKVSWVLPHGGVSAFLRLHGLDVREFCGRLAREQGVFILPGTCFGYPEYVRIGFGGATAELKEGLARVSRMLTA